MQALLSVIALVFPGAVAGLTMAQWVTIATAIMDAAPEIKAALAALHPAFEQIVGDLAQGKTPNEAAQNRIAKIPSEMSGVR